MSTSVATDLHVAVLRPPDEDQWDAYVRNRPGASFSHLIAWKHVVNQTWGHRAYYLYAHRDDAIVGVLPLFHVVSRLVGSTLLSLPNAVYAGVAANDTRIATALVGEAKRLAVALQVRHLELRSDCQPGEHEQAADPELHGKDLYVAFDHPISEDDEGVLKSFPRDIRRMIRLGWKNGLTAEFGRHELLDDFFEAYADSVHRLGTPVFPKRLFAGCLQQFGDACDIMIVRKGSRVAGAVLSFYFRETVFPYYAGAYQRFQRDGVNNFMYWELMRRAARRGCRTFDFGRSKRGTGAYDFKRGWRMRERALPYRYFLVTGKTVPDLNPLNHRFDRLIRAWKRLPGSVAKALGPAIVRHLP